ncbi:TonB-dependent receptor [Parabacteroides sp. OttesenSCG-928-G07]|nr:TonB-dependent receptor [Parabacteroides sp. OttesenSCG-928-G07]
MKRPYLFILIAITAIGIPSLKADEIKKEANDTIRNFSINEVVITSSAKETNNLRTLPGSVSILSPQIINNRQIDALKDISSFVPNLYMPDYGAKLTSAIYIRGIGARSSGQSVGLYVDNAPYLDKSTFDFELTDIQRIEVLRGPQGTLYGRNAMGGIINIYTFSPFDYQGTKASVSAGNHGQFKAKASHYRKLSETVGLSIGAYYDRHSGFFTNAYTGKKADREESAGGRLKLDWRITPSLTASLSSSFDYTDQGAFPYGRYDKETGKVSPIYINDPSNYNRKVVSNNLQLAHQTDHFTLTSTTGFQFFKDNMHMDQDYDSLSIFTLNQTQRQRAFSEELAIRSNTTNKYQWSFGLFGFYNDLHTEGPVTFKEDGIRDILQPVFDNINKNPNMPVDLYIMDQELYIPGSFDTPAYGLALFHQSTYNNLFVEGLSITAGLRLDYEKQEMDYNATAKMLLGAKTSPESPAIPLDYMYAPSVIDVHTSQDFWELLPKVSVKYAFTPETFAYITAAKGYRTGGYNVQLSADVMQSQMQYDMMSAFESMMPGKVEEPAPIEDVAAYKPEKSWNYEVGLRSNLTDRLQGELTLFYMDVTDMQLTKFVSSGNGRILTNAGKARSFGAELTLRAQLSSELTADVNYGFTHATFRDYVYEKKVEGEIQSTDCEGNYIPYTPQHTLNIGLQYNKQIRGSFIDQFTASAQFSGIGNIYWTELNDIYQNFYGTLNAKVGVRKGIVNLNLWGRNLTDTNYQAFYFESRNIPFIQLGKPVQFGVEVAVSF